MPRTGAYPTSWWSAGEVVSETIRLPLTDVPAGAYRMALGLYDAEAIRLAALDASGSPVADGRVVLPDIVEVQ
ncbi:MAG: hypothetical protein GX601_12735, partial [Anaerolineales bacterium]|nr:hypothetical protein [Anaerolineales bacterium]